jgi:hypothetical protein
MRGSFGAGFSDEQEVVRNKVGKDVDKRSYWVIMGGLLGVRQLTPTGTERKRKVNRVLTN